MNSSFQNDKITEKIFSRIPPFLFLTIRNLLYFLFPPGRPCFARGKLKSYYPSPNWTILLYCLSFFRVNILTIHLCAP